MCKKKTEWTYKRERKIKTKTWKKSIKKFEEEKRKAFYVKFDIRLKKKKIERKQKQADKRTNFK